MYNDGPLNVAATTGINGYSTDASRFITLTVAGTTDVAAVRQAMGYQTFKSPSGYEIKMDAKNHHLHKPVVIGEISESGQFDIVWQTDGPIRAEAWSPFIPDSAKKVADWTYPWVCGNCTKPTYQ